MSEAAERAAAQSWVFRVADVGVAAKGGNERGSRDGRSGETWKAWGVGRNDAGVRSAARAGGDESGEYAANAGDGESLAGAADEAAKPADVRGAAGRKDAESAD